MWVAKEAVIKKLGIDCDGVIFDFVGGFFKISNRLFGTNHDVQLQWDFDDKYTKEQVDRVWQEIRASKNWWTALRPLEGTGKLRDIPKGFEPVFITSRVPSVGHSVREQTCSALRNWFYITYPFVIVVDNPSEKIPLCKNLGIDVFIDDKRSTVLQMHNAGIKSYVRLQPYNCQESYPEGVEPVETLDEFIQKETRVG